uniref:Uncharacterized protein n=1 Tax=Cannabis sativa TaxID=3483 RepID=A0A803QQ30_CANSA
MYNSPPKEISLEPPDLIVINDPQDFFQVSVATYASLPSRYSSRSTPYLAQGEPSFAHTLFPQSSQDISNTMSDYEKDNWKWLQGCTDVDAFLSVQCHSSCVEKLSAKFLIVEKKKELVENKVTFLCEVKNWSESALAEALKVGHASSLSVFFTHYHSHVHPKFYGNVQRSVVAFSCLFCFPFIMVNPSVVRNSMAR